MMKRILLITLISFSWFYMTGQNYSFSVDGKMYSENDTVIVYADPTIDTFSFSAVFNNESNGGVNIAVIRDQVEPHGGTSNFFKWGEIYDVDTDSSSSYLFIPAGSHSPDDYFMGFYLPNSIVGISYIKYTFYNINYPDDNLNIIVEYNTVAFGVDENSLDNVLISEPYPNPASNKINVDFSNILDQEVSYFITNLSGSVIIKGTAESGFSVVNVNVSELNQGMYLLSLYNNKGQHVTKRFVVRR